MKIITLTIENSKECKFWEKEKFKIYPFIVLNSSETLAERFQNSDLLRFPREPHTKNSFDPQ
jgi:hypothetical protein